MLTQRPRGQTLVEFALIAPMFFMLLMGIIVIGIGVFYQHQLTHAAREAARFAIVNTATSQCPVVSNRAPGISVPIYNASCDTPATRWPRMTSHARNSVVGMSRGGLQISACWSGYWTKDTFGNWAGWDQLPPDPASTTNTYFRPCTIGGVDPRLASDNLNCPAPLTTLGDDMASAWSARTSGNTSQVTVYACYLWQPPMAGFLLIPSNVTLRAVVTEGLEYQQ